MLLNFCVQIGTGVSKTAGPLTNLFDRIQVADVLAPSHAYNKLDKLSFGVRK